MLKLFVRLVAENMPERKPGQGLAEYAVILAMVSTTALVALLGLADRIAALFTVVEASLPD